MPETDRVNSSKLFMRICLVNAVAACFFTAPVLVPGLAFPILLTQWGAVYMVLGYFSFLVYGVLGALGWAAAYRLMDESAQGYDKALTYLQLSTHLVSSYGVASSLFIGGYLGARLIYEGRPVQAVGAIMEVVEIPAGLFIMLAIASTLMGIINIMKLKK